MFGFLQSSLSCVIGENYQNVLFVDIVDVVSEIALIYR